MAMTERRSFAHDSRRMSRRTALACAMAAVAAESIDTATASAGRDAAWASGVTMMAGDATSAHGTLRASMRWIASWASSQQLPERAACGRAARCDAARDRAFVDRGKGAPDSILECSRHDAAAYRHGSSCSSALLDFGSDRRLDGPRDHVRRQSRCDHSRRSRLPLGPDRSFRQVTVGCGHLLPFGNSARAAQAW